MYWGCWGDNESRILGMARAIHAIVGYIAQMFYRRKLILATLESWGGKMSRLDLQKSLFLISRKQKKPAFEFVPYRFGCFSFQSYADLRAMTTMSQIRSDERECHLDSTGWVGQLNLDDQAALRQVRQEIGELTGDRLVQKVYREYPYYAIRSEIAARLLSEEERSLVDAERPKEAEEGWFSLGYEGRSVDAYLDLLIQRNIRHLVDVRKNAMSMKYGFSKSQLAKNCQALGITYTHEPDLGIETEDRQQLNDLKDYEALFSIYEATTLRSDRAEKALDRVRAIQVSDSRVALTCFERDPLYCHRSRVTAVLEGSTPLQHL